MPIAHGPSIASQVAASMESSSWASNLIAVRSIGGSVLGEFWIVRLGACKALMMPILLLLFALVGLVLCKRPAKSY